MVDGGPIKDSHAARNAAPFIARIDDPEAFNSERSVMLAADGNSLHFAGLRGQKVRTRSRPIGRMSQNAATRVLNLVDILSWKIYFGPIQHHIVLSVFRILY